MTFDPFTHIVPSGCGACHQWGYNPPIEDGVCTVCERSISAIIKEHGFLNYPFEQQADQSDRPLHQPRKSDDKSNKGD